MNKKHLTRFAAMATIALMGSTAAWADDSGYELSGDGKTLTLKSDGSATSIEITAGEKFNGVTTVEVERGSSGTTQFSTIMLPVEVSVDGHDQIVAAYTVGTMTYYDNNKVPELTMNEVTTLNANKPYIIKFKEGEYGSSTNITFSKTSGTFVVQSTAVSGEKPYTTEVSGSCFSMTGTYETKQWNNGSSHSNDYGFSADDKGGVSVGQFVRIQNNPNNDCVTIYPARAYLTCTKPQLVNGLGKVAEESLPDVINVRFVDKDGGTLSIGKMNTKTGDIQMQDRYYDLKGRKLNGKPQNKVMYVNKKVIKH